MDDVRECYCFSLWSAGRSLSWKDNDPFYWLVSTQVEGLVFLLVAGLRPELCLKEFFSSIRH
jgi:hypothetical protein